ncbi:MIP/aquaporin family protein [Spiroplasma clarkii]|uniref:Glycerol uptake facilitator protein n=1 Tax=Spiroplasma clarkii TaxID=2139 RepID=A0A2K8KHY5_9MOLU|nr:MIP/aquaporin family protein [Spiroplasma clarkii]ATX70852.1 glycerol uptake facilitator protein [Spiroplasma clarkii]
MNIYLSQFLVEMFGTFILVLIGNGVVANIVLKNTKGQNSGWLTIVVGWGFAVGLGAMLAYLLGGKAHLNPAVTVAVVIKNQGVIISGANSFGMVAIYLAAQLVGAICAQVLLDLIYIKHIHQSLSEQQQASVLAMHATGPQNKKIWVNCLSEFLATIVLVATVLVVSYGRLAFTLWSLGPMVVGAAVIAIGLGLGGTTGFAINPIRDLAPRLVHQCLPMKGKGSSDWKYGWIPVVAPLCAGVVGGALALLF